ncbi:MAG: hypothetical protein AAF558_09695 [Verrucomicrobiota bacterium]
MVRLILLLFLGISVQVSLAKNIYESDFSDVQAPNLPEHWHPTFGSTEGDLDSIFQSNTEEGQGGCLEIVVNSSQVSSDTAHWWSLAILILDTEILEEDLAKYRLSLSLKANKDAEVTIKLVALDQEKQEQGVIEFKKPVDSGWRDFDLVLEEGTRRGDFGLKAEQYTLVVSMTREGFEQDQGKESHLYIDDVKFERKAQGTYN